MLGKAEFLALHLLNQLFAQGDSGLDDPVVPAWKKELGKQGASEESLGFVPQAMFWMVLNKENLLDRDRIRGNAGGHARPGSAIGVEASASTS